MSESLIEYEVALRFALFACAFAALAAGEILAPRRALSMEKAKRWTANLGILILNTGLVRAIAPAAAVGIAIAVSARGIGLRDGEDQRGGVIYLKHPASCLARSSQRSARAGDAASIAVATSAAAPSVVERTVSR